MIDLRFRILDVFTDGDRPFSGNPLCVFEDGRCREITLYPVTLGFKQPVWERGTPRLASGEGAERTLRRFAELSAPFGTEIEIADGVGRVRVPE